VPPQVKTVIEGRGIRFKARKMLWLLKFAAENTAMQPKLIEEYSYLLDDARQSGVEVNEIYGWLISRIRETPDLCHSNNENPRPVRAEHADEFAGSPPASQDPEEQTKDVNPSSSSVPSEKAEEEDSGWARPPLHQDEHCADAVKERESNAVDQPEPVRTPADDPKPTVDHEVKQLGAPDEAVAFQCFEQNIAQMAAADEFEEGPPIRQDSDREKFTHLFHEAQRLEVEIVEIERELDRGKKEGRSKLDPKVVEQATRVFEMANLVHSEILPQRVLEEFVAEAGIRQDKRDRYAWSPLVRAVGASVEIKGARPSRPTQTRRSICAAAVHTAMSTGMTAQEFENELTHPPVRGEKHGLYHLAAEARNAKQAVEQEKAADEIAQALADLDKGGAYRVSGDFSGIASGFHLIAIKLPEDTTAVTETFGSIVVPEEEALVQRLLGNWIKGRCR
jgi:hypothetical protein